jgi:hypothetical protein
MLVDPVFQLDDVKVDQEADGEVQQAQGETALRMVKRDGVGVFLYP